jgi:thiamine monophosphate kinase
MKISSVPKSARKGSVVYVNTRHGVTKAGTAIWIRTCQHIEGWIDVPKATRARVPAPAA